MTRPRYVIGAVVSDHDSSVALVADGRLVAAINEERLCRVRRGDPRNSVRRALHYVLAEAGIDLADVDLIACDTAFYYPPGEHPPIAVFPDFPDATRIVQLDHHLGHVASAFLPSPFDEAAVLSVDASGGIAPLTHDRRRWGFLPGDLAFRAPGFLEAHEHPRVEELLAAKPEFEARNYPAESLSLCHAVRGEPIVEIENYMASASLGYFYAIGAHFLAMEEGSFMGLASFGAPNDFDRAFERIIRLEPGGRVSIDPEWLLFWSGDHVLEDPVSTRRMAPRWFETFGQPRAPQDEITQRDQLFAWSAQHRLEQALVHVARHLYDITGSENLCVAGGVGLNSVANRVVLASTPFRNIFVQPAASDDGLAIGFALFGDYVLAGLPAKKRWTMGRASTGRTYADKEIETFFAKLGAGRLPVEYFEAIPGTRAVDVLWIAREGETPQRRAMTYDAATRRWRAELPVAVGASVTYWFESVGAPIETYLLDLPREAPQGEAADRPNEPARTVAPWVFEMADPEDPNAHGGRGREFVKFLRDNRDLAGALHGEEAYIGPEHVVIDPTNRCNNNCLPCWTNSPLLGEFGPTPGWHKREMPGERLLRLIDELAEIGTKIVRFTGGGEPLMHPAIYDAVERAKERGLSVAMTSNFGPVTEEGVMRLVKAGLDELTVSLWAGTPDVYSRSHPNKTGKTFERIESHLRLYCQHKRKDQEVIMANVLFAMNFMEAREMLDFAGRVGADGMYFTLVDSVHPRTDGLLLTPPHLKVLRDHLRQVKLKVEQWREGGRSFRLDNWDGLMTRLEAVGASRGDYDLRAVEEVPCYTGWMFIRITPDGFVAPCCRGVDKPMGNLNEHSFAEIWNGAKFREFRRMAVGASKRHRYFEPIGCHRVCDNLMHNRDFHARLTGLSGEEREHLRRFIVEREGRP